MPFFAAIAVLITCLPQAHAGYPIDSTPDFSWEPEPFLPVAEYKARYIDYRNGDDRNPGTRERPWKHHPWDASSRAVSAAHSGNNIYYFKKGVTYYGNLVARESGTPDNPIALTIDPAWGHGEAIIAGSAPVESDWHACSNKLTMLLPAQSREKTWCTELQTQQPPLAAWINNQKSVRRITLARSPNWKSDGRANDPRKDWHEAQDVRLLLDITLDSASSLRKSDVLFNSGGRGYPATVTHIDGNTVTLSVDPTQYEKYHVDASLTDGSRFFRILAVSRMIDSRYLISGNHPSFDSSAFTTGDAILWSEGRRFPLPRAKLLHDFKPDSGGLLISSASSPQSGPARYSRYFLEGDPALIDSDSEFAFVVTRPGSGTLLLRPASGRKPLSHEIEISRHTSLLRLENKSHIQISGLTFRSNNPVHPASNLADDANLESGAIVLRGNISHINIRNCNFNDLTAGITAYPTLGIGPNVLDHIQISDNDFINISGSAIALGNGHRRKIYAATGSRLIHVNILRNRVHNAGLQPSGLRGAVGVMGDGILVHGGEVVEIAGNHTDRTGGPGIQLTLGSSYAKGNIERPFLRGLIHHNKVTNSLLASYDFGGIAAWTGGPVYIYNNISGNPVGYRHTAWKQKRSRSSQGSSYGIGIYLDGVYKGYVFNNIVWGESTDEEEPIYNAAAFNEATGFLHNVFNNTLHKFTSGLHRGGGTQHNRNNYLSNLLLDISNKQIQHIVRENAIDFPTLAYANNIFKAKNGTFGQLGKARKHNQNLEFIDFIALLKKNNALSSDVGILTEHDVVMDMTARDYRPSPDSPTAGRYAMVFVPWPLSRVVGEWNFYRPASQTVTIQGENINMNKEWLERMMFHDIPRNNLECRNTHTSDFIPSYLENWIDGALRFNGKDIYCSLSHETIVSGYAWNVRHYKGNKSGFIPADHRDSVDIDQENFIIESVISPTPHGAGGGIVQKSASAGYFLGITGNGRLSMSLHDGTNQFTRESSQKVNDGNWHHVLIEIKRNDATIVDIYIDGKLSNGTIESSGGTVASLANSADFEVGRTRRHGYLDGAIDFLRVSKGTLADAETTLEQLMEWQFNGPSHRDISGLPTLGQRSHAGAVEAR